MRINFTRPVVAKCQIDSRAFFPLLFCFAVDHRVAGEAVDAERDLQLVPEHVLLLPAQRSNVEGISLHYSNKVKCVYREKEGKKKKKKRKKGTTVLEFENLKFVLRALQSRGYCRGSTSDRSILFRDVTSRSEYRAFDPVSPLITRACHSRSNRATNVTNFGINNRSESEKIHGIAVSPAEPKICRATRASSKSKIIFSSKWMNSAWLELCNV